MYNSNIMALVEKRESQEVFPQAIRKLDDFLHDLAQKYPQESVMFCQMSLTLRLKRAHELRRIRQHSFSDQEVFDEIDTLYADGKQTGKAARFIQYKMLFNNEYLEEAHELNSIGIVKILGELGIVQKDQTRGVRQALSDHKNWDDNTSALKSTPTSLDPDIFVAVDPQFFDERKFYFWIQGSAWREFLKNPPPQSPFDFNCSQIIEWAHSRLAEKDPEVELISSVA